jgi:hypothetical protein
MNEDYASGGMRPPIGAQETEYYNAVPPIPKDSVALLTKKLWMFSTACFVYSISLSLIAL